MENWVVYTAQDLGEEALRGFVLSVGGQWEEGPHAQGVIPSQNGIVYLTSGHTFEDIEPEEIAALGTSLEAPPKTWVSTHIGHGPGSRDLAAVTARAFIKRWGGLLDKNEIEPQR